MKIESRFRIGDYEIVEVPVKLKMAIVCCGDYRFAGDEFQANAKILTTRHVRVNQVDILVADNTRYPLEFCEGESSKVRFDYFDIGLIDVCFDPRVRLTQNRHLMTAGHQFFAQVFAVNQRTVYATSRYDLQDVQS